MDKVNKRTKISYKIGQYIIVSIGYLLIIAGIVMLALFGRYTGKPESSITDDFYYDAAEKYSVAAVTGDERLDYNSKNFRYIICRKYDLNTACLRIKNRPDDVDGMISDKNATKNDIYQMHRYMNGQSVGGRVFAHEYTYKKGDGYGFGLSTLSYWPYLRSNTYALGTEGPNNTYTVISYVPYKISDNGDLFSRIAPAVKNVMIFSWLGIALLIAGIILFVSGVVFFLLAAGHTVRPVHPELKNHLKQIADNDYIERRSIGKIPLDLGFIIYLIAVLIPLGIGLSFTFDYDTSIGSMIAGVIAMYICIPLTAAFFHSLVVNIKIGDAGKNTVIYYIYRCLRKKYTEIKAKEYLRNEVRDFSRRSETLYFIDLGADVLIGIIAIIGAASFFAYDTGGIALIVIAFIIFVIKEVYKHKHLRHFIEGFGTIKASVRKIADGDLGYQTGTAELSIDEKQIVDDLNSISTSIDKAVDERMKSEHMQTELITNVSHDIRTPLTSIINYTDLLSKSDITDEQKNEYLEVLKKQSNKLKKLINDLIDASKAESGKLEMHPEDINAGTMLSMMAGEYEEKLSERNVMLEVTGLEDETTIKADPNYLGRVFQNLFGNMVKYAQPGTRAYVDIESSDSKVTVIFRNISSERLHITADELTERFVRGDISRTTEGSGLGLSIAKNLTELMGGQFVLTIDGDLFKVELTF